MSSGFKRSDVIVASEAHAEARDQFVAAMNAVCSREGWREREAVAHFLEASFRAMRGRLLGGETYEKNEAEYMRIVRKCRHPKESMRDLSAMLGATIKALDADPVDFLGPIFSLTVASDSLGQFFTPHTVSRMLAEMTLDNPQAMLKDSGRSYLLCHEPACGVGGMVLAATQVLKAKGLNPARQAHWVMVDLDFLAMCGAYIQANLCGVSAVVVHGNTLTMQEWMSTPTIAALLYPKREHQTEPATASEPSMEDA